MGCIGCGGDASDGRPAVGLNGFLRCEDQSARSVVERGGVGRSDGTILLKGRAQGAYLLHFDLAEFLIDIHLDGVAFALGNGDRNHFIGECTFGPSFGRTRVALDGKVILGFPADVVFFGTELGAIAHVGGVVHIGQTVQ